MLGTSVLSYPVSHHRKKKYGEKTKTEYSIRGSNLGGEDDGVAVEEEGEVAGEVEWPREPLPSGHVQHGAATVLAGVLRQVVHRGAERRGVGGGAVAHAAEVRERRRVRPAGRRQVHALPGAVRRGGHVVAPRHRRRRGEGEEA